MQHLHSQGIAVGINRLAIGKVTTVPVEPPEHRSDYFLDLRDAPIPADHLSLVGYVAVISRSAIRVNVPHVHSLPQLDYVSAGDVLAVEPSGWVKVLFRHQSPHNTILTTERCNSLCLMCSQPPKPDDDRYRVPIIMRLLDLIDERCPELILSGGEPLLLGDDFFAIVEKCATRLPRTALHVLTNGRLFKSPLLASRLADIHHPDLMLGIPLYSDCDDIHDYVVQARGAFDETIHGLYNLAQVGVPIEIRVVVHRQTYERLPELAEFIHRNLPFVSQVVLMGMEMFGLVHHNLDTLWIDPVEYQDHLEEATLMLAERGMRVLLYNHQLCVLRRSLWRYAVKSISDWKNAYIAECEDCAMRSECGGFFQSGVKRHSLHISPIRTAPTSVTAIT